MLSKRYESTEVDRRTWLHVPSVLIGFTIYKCTHTLQYKGRDLTKSCDKSNYTQKTQKARRQHKNATRTSINNNCGPTKDGQLEWRQSSNWYGLIG